jgi:Transposase DDE domain
MPEPVWIYLMALLYFTKVSTWSTMADAFDSASHDGLTRRLHGDWSGHTLLEMALRVLFGVAGGYLILDDTVVEKPYARLWGEAAWGWSSKQQKVVFGVSMVLRVGTDGKVRLPVGYRIWHTGGDSKYTCALELLRYARNRLKCKPQFVLFDSWYPSKPLLRRIRDYGWYFVCQLKKNRRLEGIPLHLYLQQPYWQATGTLAGGMQVFVVRYRRQYYATNRLRLTAKEVRAHYRRRHEVEEVLRPLQKPAESGGLASRLQAPCSHHVTTAASCPRASHRAVSGGLPGGGARAPRSRSVVAQIQTASHPQRCTGRVTSIGAGEKGCVTSAAGNRPGEAALWLAGGRTRRELLRGWP